MKCTLAVVPVKVVTPKAVSTAGACAAVKTSGTSAGVLGSAPLTVKAPFAPEKTETGLIGATVGGSAALTSTVEVAVEVPLPLVTVSDRLTVVSTATAGAV